MSTLIDEIRDDPLTRGYSGMTADEIHTSLHTANRTRIKPSMSGDEIFAATNATEFAALTDVKRSLWMAFCGRDSINPQGASNVALVTWMFGAGSNTVAALVALRSETVSRTVELGISRARVGDILRALADIGA